METGAFPTLQNDLKIVHMTYALYFKSSEATWWLYPRNKPKLNLLFTAILYLQWAVYCCDWIWHWMSSTFSRLVKSQWSESDYWTNRSERGLVNQSNTFIEKICWSLENRPDSATSLVNSYELSKDLHCCLFFTQSYCLASKDIYIYR